MARAFFASCTGLCVRCGVWGRRESHSPALAFLGPAAASWQHCMQSQHRPSWQLRYTTLQHVDHFGLCLHKGCISLALFTRMAMNRVCEYAPSPFPFNAASAICRSSCLERSLYMAPRLNSAGFCICGGCSCGWLSGIAKRSSCTDFITESKSAAAAAFDALTPLPPRPSKRDAAD